MLIISVFSLFVSLFNVCLTYNLMKTANEIAKESSMLSEKIAPLNYKIKVNDDKTVEINPVEPSGWYKGYLIAKIYKNDIFIHSEEINDDTNKFDIDLNKLLVRDYMYKDEQVQLPETGNPAAEGDIKGDNKDEQVQLPETENPVARGNIKENNKDSHENDEFDITFFILEGYGKTYSVNAIVYTEGLGYIIFNELEIYDAEKYTQFEDDNNFSHQNIAVLREKLISGVERLKKILY